jgi:protein tyrosine phosphatase (PTP) superfamily phosphohydrolase (DUF442 family)
MKAVALAPPSHARPLAIALLLSLLLLALPFIAHAAPTVPGIPNFHQVNERVYRGGQPIDQSWAGLRALGVNTVIDLRQTTEHNCPAEKRAVEAAGMKYVSVPMNGFETPTSDQVAKVVSMMDAPGDTVFIHCKQGRDRTGTIVAAYRITHDKWDNARALDEAHDKGIHWFSVGMKRFIRAYKSPVVVTPDQAAKGELARAPASDSLAAPAATAGAN